MDLRRNLNPLSIAYKHKTNGECTLNAKYKRQVPFYLLLTNEKFSTTTTNSHILMYNSKS